MVFLFTGLKSIALQSNANLCFNKHICFNNKPLNVSPDGNAINGLFIAKTYNGVFFYETNVTFLYKNRNM